LLSLALGVQPLSAAYLLRTAAAVAAAAGGGTGGRRRRGASSGEPRGGEASGGTGGGGPLAPLPSEQFPLSPAGWARGPSLVPLPVRGRVLFGLKVLLWGSEGFVRDMKAVVYAGGGLVLQAAHVEQTYRRRKQQRRQQLANGLPPATGQAPAVFRSDVVMLCSGGGVGRELSAKLDVCNVACVRMAWLVSSLNAQHRLPFQQFLFPLEVELA